jgi:hypothetical protein
MVFSDVMTTVFKGVNQDVFPYHAQAIERPAPEVRFSRGVFNPGPTKVFHFLFEI